MLHSPFSLMTFCGSDATNMIWAIEFKAILLGQFQNSSLFSKMKDHIEITFKPMPLCST